MKKPLLFAVIMIASLPGLRAVAQNGGAASQPATSPGRIGPAAVWQTPQDFLSKAHAACDKGNPPNYAECFIDQMSKAGAPAETVNFTRTYYQQSDGQVAIISGFDKVGLVDIARVMYPLRANDNYGLLLVNGDPKILDVDDLKKLDRAPMDQNPMYQSVKQKYPNTDLWPDDRSGTNWPQTRALPDGGQQFIVGYLLINGCHACAHVGSARFSWNFDPKGKFLGTKYIVTPPPPKITQPRRVPPPAPPQ